MHIQDDLGQTEERINVYSKHGGQQKLEGIRELKKMNPVLTF
jgi:hypothetical protein